MTRMISFENLPAEERNFLAQVAEEVFPGSVVVNAFRKDDVSDRYARMLLLRQGKLFLLRLLQRLPSRVPLHGQGALPAEEFRECSNGLIVYSRSFFASCAGSAELSSHVRAGESGEKFIYELADALGALHGLGIVHGNICPENIGYESGRVYLLDAELARCAEASAPEVAGITGEEYSQASDIRALARTMLVTCGRILPENSRRGLELAERGEADLRLVLSLMRPDFKGRSIQADEAAEKRGKLVAVHQSSKVSPETASPTLTSDGGITQPSIVSAHVSPQPSLESRSDERETSGASLHIFIVLAAAFIILMAALSLISETKTQRARSPIERSLQVEWGSARPELRQALAARAVRPREQEARDVVLRSCRVALERQSDVQCPLLNFVMDEEWSGSLTEYDRQMVFRLALLRYLPEESVVELEVARLSPLVQLAVLGFFPGADPPLFAAEILTEELATLPGHLGLTFRFFTSQGVDDCYHPLCFFMSRLLVREAAQSVRVASPDEFFSAAIFRMLLLNLIPFFDESQLNSLRSILISDSPVIRELYDSAQYLQLDPQRFLELVAFGANTDVELSFIEAVLLAVEGGDAVRTQARAIVAAGLQGKAPAQFVQEILSPEFEMPMEYRTLLLYAIGERDKDGARTVFLRWLESEPDERAVLAVVTSLRATEELGLLSFLGARYLREREFHLPREHIDELMQHHDAFVRAYAYSSLDPSVAGDRETLENIRAVEPVERLRRAVGRILGEDDVPGDPTADEQEESEWFEF